MVPDLGHIDLVVLAAKSEDVSAVTKPLCIDENDNDYEAKGYEEDSRDAEDLEESAKDFVWGVPITMSW